MNAPASIGSIAKQLVEQQIAAKADPAERKQLILIAREEGVLTDREAADWIAICEARAA
jgi:hypothetical protein